VTGDESAGGRLDLTKEPVPARPGPAWIVVPARVIALIVVLPLRLVHDLLVATGRGLGAVGRAFHRWLLAPIGRFLAAVGRGIGALLDLLLARPLRWLGVVVILGLLRLLARGSGRFGRWLQRVLIIPVGRFLAMIGRGLGRVLEFVLLRPLRGLAWLLSGAWRGVVLLIGVLVVVPAALLWQYVLRPPLLALAWLGRRAFGVLAAALSAFAAGLAWAWRLLGRCLAWLGHVLFVVPATVLWRYLLAPVLAGVVGTWRLASRVLRRLWRTLVVVPVRVVIVAPARWVRTSVLRPIGHGIGTVWRVSVREPVRSVRRTMRQASRDVRLTLRRTFLGR
jgi:hypothetical protein